MIRDEAGAGLKLPPPSVGPNSRPARKAELVDELENLLASPGVVDALIESAPSEAAELARTMADGRPTLAVHLPIHHTSYLNAYQRQPAYWLFERALLMPLDNYGTIAAQPRSVGVALRGGRPVPELAMRQPSVAVGTTDQPTVDGHAAAGALRTLDLLADMLERRPSRRRTVPAVDRQVRRVGARP